MQTLTPIIVDIINLPLDSGSFPDHLPIYKGGQKYEMPHYRPISIVSITIYI